MNFYILTPESVIKPLFLPKFAAKNAVILGTYKMPLLRVNKRGSESKANFCPHFEENHLRCFESPQVTKNIELNVTTFTPPPPRNKTL